MGWFRSLRRGVTWVTLGAAGGAAFVTARHLLQTPQPLESVLPGEARIDRRHGGDIFYNVGGPADAAPLVLLHDFYPGASNFEFRNIFSRLAKNARVYAPDWLGFGMSEHPHVAYTGEFYAGMLAGFLRDTLDRPAIVLANGLAGNVAVRAASDAPDLFARLILVSPEVTAGEGPEPTLGQTAARSAQRVALGLVPYALLSTRPALRWAANRRATTTAADEEQLDHIFASAHQFGGQHALLALLTGDLDLPMSNALPLLRPPLLIVAGADDPKRPREVMEDAAVLNPHADLEVVPDAGAAVFEDQPAAFIDAVEAWVGVPAPRNVPRASMRTAAAYLGGASNGQPRAASEGDVYTSPLLPPMDDMGAPVPEIAPTDLRSDAELDEPTAAAYTPDDMGASAADASGASGPVRPAVSPAVDSGAMGRRAARADEQAAASDAGQPAPTGATGATEDQVGAPAGLGSPAGNAAAEPMPVAEEEVGGAGYVTPGVSDMGLEGPSTETVNSGTVATNEPAAAATDTGAAGDGESTTGLIPEAGEVARFDDRAELEAREGVSPPVEEGANIADPSLVGSAEGADEGAGEGPTGRAGGTSSRPVATTDTAVTTGDEAVATPDNNVATAASAVETTESAAETEDGELPTLPVRAVRPGAEAGASPDVAPASEDAPQARPESSRRPAGERTQQTTSATTRQTGARTARESGGKGTSGNRGATPGTGKGSKGGKGGASRQGHNQGHKK